MAAARIVIAIAARARRPRADPIDTTPSQGGKLTHVREGKWSASALKRSRGANLRLMTVATLFLSACYERPNRLERSVQIPGIVSKGSLEVLHSLSLRPPGPAAQRDR